MENRPLILIADDQPEITKLVSLSLDSEGFRVITASDGPSALEQLSESNPDVLLLDIMMPGMSGLDVLREVREHHPVPVIMLSARGATAQVSEGLNLGADDYVVKPFSVRELLARVEAVLRRSPERPNEIDKLPLPGGIADLARREIRYRDGTRCELSEREADLLRYLAGNAGRAISRDEILTRVWRLNPAKIETRTIDMHIANLREKLQDNTDEPKVLLTVRGKGYMFAKLEPPK